MGKLLTPKEVAIELWQTDQEPVVDHNGKLKRTYRNRVYQWIAADVIRHIKVGNRYYIPRSAIDEL